MALIRVAQYNSTPTVVEDYQAQNAHLQAFTNQLLTQQFILDSGTDQPVIKQGCYVSHGGSLYVADADTSITGSPSDGSVYIRVSGTTSLTVEFVTNISGYTWNPVYSALTNSTYTLLPYLIVKASTVWTRYNFNPNNQQFGSLASLVVNGNATVGGALGVTGAISGASVGVTGNATVGGTLGVTGAISGASIDTGQGVTEVHLMNQNLRTTDSPTFASINTGYGDNEVYKISNETIDFGTVNNSSITKQISSMNSGDIKFVRTTGTLVYDDDDDYYARLNAPSGGTYLVLAGVPSTDKYTAIGIVVGGGAAIWNIGNDDSHNIDLAATILIRRL